MRLTHVGASPGHSRAVARCSSILQIFNGKRPTVLHGRDVFVYKLSDKRSSSSDRPRTAPGVISSPITNHRDSVHHKRRYRRTQSACESGVTLQAERLLFRIIISD